jgi:hypothetical protein
MVVHSCNPSQLQVRDQEEHSPRLALGKFKILAEKQNKNQKGLRA